MKDFQDITSEDPRLTAYALGELTNADEIAAIEKAIAANPSLAAAVDEIHATAKLLGDAFTEDSHLASAPESNFPESEDSISNSQHKVIRFPAWLGLTAAACAAATIGIVSVLQEEPKVREVGQLTPRAVETVILESPSKPEPVPTPSTVNTVSTSNSEKLAVQTPVLPPQDEFPGEISKTQRLSVQSESELASVLDANKGIPATDEDTFAVAENTPAPRPKVEVNQPPIQKQTLTVDESKAIEVVKPGQSQLVASGSIGVESQYVFRGKAQEGPSMQSGIGLSVRPGEAETNSPVTLHMSNRYYEPVDGNRFANTDIQVAKTPGEGTANTTTDDIMVVEEIASTQSVSKAENIPAPTAPMPVDGGKIIANSSPVAARTLPARIDGADYSNEFKKESHYGAGFAPLEPEVRVPQPDPEYRRQTQPSNTEGYLPSNDNAFQSPRVEPLSTFSIDVDTASYANVRRFIERGQLPPPDAVRIEELVNYFPYDYPAPNAESESPLAIYLEAAPSPWAPEHRLVRVGMKAKDIAWDERPPSNLVFLIDVSGSMNRPNKLPLVKDALAKLIRRLDARDRVAIVVYAGASGLVLPSTTANNSETISHALNNLKAGGSTNGGEGLALAYKVAQDNLLDEGNNRIILCTDGDFNVGKTDKGSIADMAAEHAKDGIYLTVLGFGMGNYKDDMLENLSNRGNGNYAYIDSEREARKVFIEQAAGTLLTVAKDVKIQVEFNPSVVKAYRLIGYENRILAARDFNDDTKDAGEVGAGHSVTALYEIVPGTCEDFVFDIDPLKYQEVESKKLVAEDEGVDFELPNEMLTVKMRYKLPEADTSTKEEFILRTDEALMANFDKASTDFRFAAAVVEFGLVLRNSPYKGEADLSESRNIAEGALGSDPGGHHIDFVELVEKVMPLVEETKE